jgi:hypothetical protein
MSVEDRLRQLFQDLIARYAGAIEYWTVACASRDDLGDPAEFVEGQWAQLHQTLHEVRFALSELRDEPAPVVDEQVAKLFKLSADLRDLFAVLVQYQDRPPEKVEQAVLKLGFLWKELRLRIALAAAAVPLPDPLPGITSEQEAHYQRVLDGLFDRFAATDVTR